MRRPRHPHHPVVRLAGTLARLPRYLNLAQALVREPALSGGRKAALAAGIGYVLLPLDLVPGIIPIAGQLDDLAALLLGLRQALNGCPPEVAERHLARVGLSRTALDADLRTVAVTSVWLVRRIGALGARALSGSVSLVRRGLGATRREAPA